MLELNQPCEICGQPATQMVQDAKEILGADELRTQFRRWVPDGDPHFYCDVHRRDDIRRDLTDEERSAAIRQFLTPPTS